METGITTPSIDEVPMEIQHKYKQEVDIQFEIQEKKKNQQLTDENHDTQPNQHQNMK